MNEKRSNNSFKKLIITEIKKNLDQIKKIDELIIMMLSNSDYIAQNEKLIRALITFKKRILKVVLNLAKDNLIDINEINY